MSTSGIPSPSDPPTAEQPTGGPRPAGGPPAGATPSGATSSGAAQPDAPPPAGPPPADGPATGSLPTGPIPIGTPPGPPPAPAGSGEGDGDAAERPAGTPPPPPPGRSRPRFGPLRPRSLVRMGPWAPAAGAALGLLAGLLAVLLLGEVADDFGDRLALVFLTVGLTMLGAAAALLADEVRLVRRGTREAGLRPAYVEATANLVNGLTPARLLLLASAFVLFLAAYVA